MRERPAHTRRTREVYCAHCQAAYYVRPDSKAKRCRYCKAPLTGVSSFAQQVLKRLKTRTYSLVELANEFNAPPKKIQAAVTELNGGSR